MISYLIAGVIIGLLGKFVAPSKSDNIPFWLTMICGIGGAMIGYGLFGGTGGFDWVAFASSVALAAVLTVVAATVMARKAA